VRNFRKRMLLLTLLALCSSVRAQSPPPDLRGIYVGGNNILNENPKTLIAGLSVPGVDGLLLNLGWDDIEPAMGQYQWAALDQWMTQAISSGKKVTLSVGDGMRTPSWLFQAAPDGAGAKPLNFSISRKGGASNVCDAETIAAPWDPAFLKRWDSMLTALSAHLKSAGTYNAIVLLRLTGINRDTDELHLPEETAKSTGLACVSDAIAAWQQAGYRPSLLLQGWDSITSSFKKNFPDKSFTVAIIARTNTPFPPIAEDGSILTGNIPDLSGPPLMLASQKFPGHLVIQNNTLYPSVPAQPATIQFAQSLGTMLAFQTNEDLFSNTGKRAGCGTSFSDAVSCTNATYLALLDTGIYPLGQSNSLRSQYIELFAGDAIAFPDDILQSHFLLAPPMISQVANAEGESPTIAPNTWVEIKGAGLSLTGDARIWKGSDFVSNKMPTQLDAISATVNGKSAFVYYISPAQVNILTPPDAMSGPVQVQLTNNGVVTAAFTAQAQPLSPSFFVFDGTHLAAIHLNGSYVGPSSLYPGLTTPAKPGETLELYANGFGPTSTPVVSGSTVQSGALSPLPVIKIGGTNATVLFAGLVGPGEFQFNVVVPPNTPDGEQPITATYNGLSTQSGTVLTVQH